MTATDTNAEWLFTSEVVQLLGLKGKRPDTQVSHLITRYGWRIRFVDPRRRRQVFKPDIDQYLAARASGEIRPGPKPR